MTILQMALILFIFQRALRVPLQRNQGCCIPKPQPSSPRDHQGATSQITQQDTVTLVSL
jgi:hypothetical protein